MNLTNKVRQFKFENQRLKKELSTPKSNGRQPYTIFSKGKPWQTNSVVDIAVYVAIIVKRGTSKHAMYWKQEISTNAGTYESLLGCNETVVEHTWNKRGDYKNL